MARKILAAAGAAAAAGPLLKAGFDGARFASRSRSARRNGQPLAPGVPAPDPTLALGLSVALDRVFTMPMGLLASAFGDEHYERSSAELDQALQYYEARGWLTAVDGFFDPPTSEGTFVVESSQRPGSEHLSFESGWNPHDGEVGGDRWRSFTANATVPVTLLRHPGEPRPWLIALHGQGMGTGRDAAILRMHGVHRELGLNVALPVLPLHGPRRAGLAADQQFVSNVYPVNDVLGLGQAMWDIRRLLAWLRVDQAAPAVGVLGFSLGSYACSVLATLDADLACAIAVVPNADLAGALRDAEPLAPSKRRWHRVVHDERSATLHGIVSPLARPCVVPHDRRFIVAGQGDQVAAPVGAARLWEHWDRPSIEWRPRGHLTTGLSAAYDRYLADILTRSGLRTT